MRRVGLSFAAWLIASVAAGGEPAGPAEVVRLYGAGPQNHEHLRREGDLWGINWREDYVLMRLESAARVRLEQAGFIIRTDWAETARLEAFAGQDRDEWRARGA